MDLGLEGKVALVTGAGSQIGFGKGIALILAQEGCDIVVNDINYEGAKQTAAEVEALGRKAIAIKADVSKTGEVNKMVASALRKLGKIDILVNNAGVSSGMRPFAHTTEEDWDKDLSVDFKGTLYCTKAVLPQMIEHRSGKIINIASGAAVMAVPNGSTYAAAKAAVLGFSRSIAVELAPLKINVNVIAPGLGNTGFQSSANLPPEFYEFIRAAVAEGKIVTTQDIGNAVAFLASDVSRNISGQVLNLWVESSNVFDACKNWWLPEAGK